MLSIHYAWLRWCACIAALLVCWVFLAPLQASASPITYSTVGPDDITTSGINVSYVPSGSTGTLDLTYVGGDYNQSVQTLADPGSANYFTDITFSISATVNATTGALISGTVNIAGDDNNDYSIYPPYYSGSSPPGLLEGNLTGFGFPNNTSQHTGLFLEFTFSITGGVMATSPGPFYDASGGGITVDMDTSTAPFTNGWPAVGFQSGNSDNSGDTNADTVVTSFTPEPSTFVLFALGLLPVALRLRRRGYHPA